MANKAKALHELLNNHDLSIEEIQTTLNSGSIHELTCAFQRSLMTLLESEEHQLLSLEDILYAYQSRRRIVDFVNKLLSCNNKFSHEKIYYFAEFLFSDQDEAGYLEYEDSHGNIQGLFFDDNNIGFEKVILLEQLLVEGRCIEFNFTNLGPLSRKQKELIVSAYNFGFFKDDLQVFIDFVISGSQRNLNINLGQKGNIEYCFEDIFQESFLQEIKEFSADIVHIGYDDILSDKDSDEPINLQKKSLKNPSDLIEQKTESVESWTQHEIEEVLNDPEKKEILSDILGVAQGPDEMQKLIHLDEFYDDEIIDEFLELCTEEEQEHFYDCMNGKKQGFISFVCENGRYLHLNFNNMFGEDLKIDHKGALKSFLDDNVEKEINIFYKK